jgi:hypothetical protein
MNRGWLINALLLLAVAGLTSWIYVKPQSGDTRVRVTTLQGADATNIRLERRGDPAIELVRRDGNWQLVQPFTARAETFQVERLLSVVEASATQRLAASDLARYELDEPLTRLTVNGVALSYGAVNAVTREQYVLTGGAVYALPARYGAMIPTNVDQLIARQLFAPKEKLARLEFPHFTVARDAKWTVSPDVAGLSQDDIARWLETWQHASALRTERHAEAEAIETINITLNDGAGLAVQVLHKGPDYVIARADENVRYYIAAESAKRMLSPPRALP